MLQFMIIFHTKPTVSACQPYEAMTSVVKLFDCGCENCLFTITCTAKLKGLILLPKLIKTQDFGKIFLNFCDLPSGHVLGLPSVSIAFFSPCWGWKWRHFRGRCHQLLQFVSSFRWGATGNFQGGIDGQWWCYLYNSLFSAGHWCFTKWFVLLYPCCVGFLHPFPWFSSLNLQWRCPCWPLPWACSLALAVAI